MKTLTLYYDELDSPVGPLTLVGDGSALTGLYMHDQRHLPSLPQDAEPKPSAFKEARAQLRAYFAGKLRKFDIPLRGTGTAFQERVWRELYKIPFGKTESYGGLAKRIGNPNAMRAVGLANGRNPIAIIVPCHRVIGADGSMTGYGGGIERKKWLLQHEGIGVP